MEIKTDVQKQVVGSTYSTDVEVVLTDDGKAKVNGQNIDIKDGQILLNGVEIGSLRKVLKRGFHPVGEITVGSIVNEFELDIADLYVYICQQAYIMYQQDKGKSQAPIAKEVTVKKTTQVAPNLGVTESKHLKEEVTDGFKELSVYGDPKDKDFHTYVIKAMEQFKPYVSMSVIENTAKTEYELVIQLVTKDDSIKDKVDLAISDIDVEARKGDRIIAPLVS